MVLSTVRVPGGPRLGDFRLPSRPPSAITMASMASAYRSVPLTASSVVQR